MSLLTDLKLQLGDRAAIFSDDLLNLTLSDVSSFLDGAGADASLHPALVRRLTVIRLNQFGSEGVSSESYSGISQSFLATLPDDIRKEIMTARQVVW